MENVNVDEFVRSGGRIARIREEAPGLPSVEERTITIAYRRDSGKIHYGATIHRKMGSSQNFVKKPHNQTAVRRLRVSPVTVPDRDFDHPAHREKYLRECLKSHGCSGERSEEG